MPKYFIGRSALAGAAVLLVSWTLAPQAAAQTLEQRIARAGDGWVGFHFPARQGVCGYDHGGFQIRRGGDDGSVTIRGRYHKGNVRCEEGPVRVGVSVRGGRVGELRVRVGSELRVGGTDLGAVPAAEAAGYLLSLAERAPEDVGEEAVVAAALADGVQIHPRLLRLAAEEQVPEETREQAVFWAGELGATVPELVALYDRIRAGEVKEKVLFALSQREDEAAARALLRVARGDEPRSLRKTAVFWLGQAAGRAVTADLGALANDDAEDQEVREHAVFALSQRPADEAVPALLRIARESPNTGVRKKAMFWLAESGDPRAIELFEQILVRRDR